MKTFAKALSVSALALAVGVASATPSQAFNPGGVLGIAKEVGVVGAVAGGTVATVSGVGEVLAIGYGAYLAYTQLDQIFKFSGGYHSGSATDPIVQGNNSSTPSWVSGTLPQCAGACTPTSWPGTTVYPISQNAMGLDFTHSFSAKNYTGAGAVTVVGVEPLFTSGARIDFGKGSDGVIDEIGCGINVKTVSTGVINSWGTYFFPTSSIGASATNVSTCTAGLQTIITSAGVDNVTKVLQSIVVYGCGSYSLFGANQCNSVALGSTASSYWAGKQILDEVQVVANTQTASASTICAKTGSTDTTYLGTTSTSGTTTQVTIRGCPSGWYTKSVSVTNTDGIMTTTLYNWSEISPASTSYPSCGASAQCALSIYYAGAPCTTDISNCVDWFTLQTSAPADYSCHWGTYTLPTLASCQGLKYHYNPIANRNTDGFGTSLGSVVTTPTTDTSVSGTSTATDDGFIGCAPSGWGLLNPFAFIGGLGCMTKWAFIPSSGFFTSASAEVSSAWDASSAGAFVTAVIAVPASLAPLAGVGQSGCTGPALTINLPAGLTQTLHPLDACSAPMSTVATMVKTANTIFLMVGGVFLVYNPIASALGFQKITLGRKEEI